MRVFPRWGVIGALAILAAPAIFSAPLWAQNTGQMLEVQSGGKAYTSYLAAAPGEGRKPGIVLVHSFTVSNRATRTSWIASPPTDSFLARVADIREEPARRRRRTARARRGRAPEGAR